MAVEKKTSKLAKPSLAIPFTSTQLLYSLLLIAVFLIGYLLATVQYMGKTQTTALGTQAAVPGAQPSTAPVHADVTLGHFPIKGKTDAKVAIIEFADFRCPFCQQFFNNVKPQIMKDYVDTGKAKFVFRQFAFLGPPSTVAANAAECANEQNKFWEFHDYLYQNQPPESDTTMYNSDKLTPIATSLGMNSDQFKSCLDSNKFAKQATDDMADGQKAGVSGTPTFYVNGTQLVGAQPYTAFKTIIDRELAKTPKAFGIF